MGAPCAGGLLALDLTAPRRGNDTEILRYRRYRGLTNREPMTAQMALSVGMAAGAHFLRGDHRHRVVIGKDTRLSGYMMESAMVAGFTSVGMDVVLLGPMPTPAVAMLTRSMRADLGVMISASHNPFADNGIKLFGPTATSSATKTSMRSRRGSTRARSLPIRN